MKSEIAKREEELKNQAKRDLDDMKSKFEKRLKELKNKASSFIYDPIETLFTHLYCHENGIVDWANYRLVDYNQQLLLLVDSDQQLIAFHDFMERNCDLLYPNEDLCRTLYFEDIETGTIVARSTTVEEFRRIPWIPRDRLSGPYGLYPVRTSYTQGDRHDQWQICKSGLWAGASAWAMFFTGLIADGVSGDAEHHYADYESMKLAYDAQEALAEEGYQVPDDAITAEQVPDDAITAEQVPDDAITAEEVDHAWDHYESAATAAGFTWFFFSIFALFFVLCVVRGCMHCHKDSCCKHQ